MVIKLVPKVPGADRELLFEDLGRVPNVVPILDSGEWSDVWVLVMPRAERSLRDYLGENIEHLSIADTVQVLTDITQALSELLDYCVEEEFERVPSMEEYLGRQTLDAGISQTLGPPNLAAPRRMLVSEPVVSNRRL